MTSPAGVRFAAVLASAGTAAALSLPSAEMPPAGYTGGFGEPTCVTCHIGNDLNAFGGTLTLDGLPDAWEPGRSYVLTVRLQVEETDAAGFQLTARFASGDNAGTLRPVDHRTAVRDSLGILYAHHSSTGTTPRADRGGSSWSLEWLAPPGVGDVVLSVAANSGNADDSPLGDLVYTSETVLPARVGSAPPSGTAEPARRGGAGPRQVAIDTDRLLFDLSVLAHDSMEGRAAGSPGGARARDFLVRALREAGVEPLGDRYEVEFPLGDDRGAGVNLLGLVPGTLQAPYLVLSAHYDHVGVRDGQIFNGADDNASGTAAVLAIARILRAEPTRHPLIVALFDAEEGGLRGARHFVGDPPVPLDRILLDVNLDMVARANGVLWAGGAHHTPALRPILESVARDAPLALRLGHDRPGAPEGDDWTLQSDHAAFHRVGIPFVYFGVEDHPDYHRPTDDVEAVDPLEYVASVRTILAAVRALDAAMPLPPS